MHEPELVAGLDIGTTKICAIVGMKNEHGKIEILGMGKAESMGVNRGIVMNIERTVQAIKHAIAEAESESGVDIKQLNVGIAGQHIQSLRQKGMITLNKTADDEIDQKDLDNLTESMYKLAMAPGYEIIHVLPQEYKVDNEEGIRDPVGMAGSRLEADFHIITGEIASANNIYKCVRKSNCEVQDLILEPLASAEAVLTEEEKEAGVVLVDIGGGTTDIAIFHEGIIRHTKVIPVGGNSLTNDIQEGCQIMKNQAELLKVKFGNALSMEAKENEVVSIPGIRGREAKEISMKNLAKIIEARMEELIGFVKYDIKDSGYYHKVITGVVLTGGGAMLKNVRPLCEKILGLSVRIGTPNEHIAKGSNDIKSPMYATTVGLVIKGFQELEMKKRRLGVTENTPVNPQASSNEVKDLKEENKKKYSFIDKIKGFFSDNLDGDNFN